MNASTDKTEHHIWCSYFLTPAEECRMCKRLRKRYPIEELTPDEMMTKHFPNAIKVRGT